MKIATWNINGVKARLETAQAWLKHSNPDIACFQEIKSIDDGFPSAAFEDLGYNVATHGQKGFNGVAILSKLPLEDVSPRLPGDDEDVQARYLEATVSTQSGSLKVASLYLPNGNPLGTEKFTYKLAWMRRLEEHIKTLLAQETPFILAGDYNVIPHPEDAKRPEVWGNDALFQPESREQYQRYLGYGLTDAIRACIPDPGTFTFWDYQAGAWNKNNGIRIDHLLMSPDAADKLQRAGIDRETRGWEKPSDHVPVWVEIK
ncbi:MAG: exodeoxyribonuclease III [Hyphomicrobiaceae bacterium]